MSATQVSSGYVGGAATVASFGTTLAVIRLRSRGGPRQAPRRGAEVGEVFSFESASDLAGEELPS